jgi:acetolactate synthase-1/2/3 large subunit
MVSTPLEDLFPFLDREELRANMLVPLIDEEQ